jgi:shikimate 5-dehydrogenase
MLVEQAAIAFELFRGIKPETAPVLEALRARAAAMTQATVPNTPA